MNNIIVLNSITDSNWIPNSLVYLLKTNSIYLCKDDKPQNSISGNDEQSIIEAIFDAGDAHLYYTILLFKHIDLIIDSNLKQFVIEVLNKVPVEFHYVPASSTGKHHPEQSNGTGGLVRHILATLYFAIELFCAYGPLQDTQDVILASLILHDIGKVMDEPHDIVAATNLRWLNKAGNPLISETIECVRWHMGRWSTGSTDCQEHERGSKNFPFDFTLTQQIVHLADYMASRKRVNLTKLGVIS